jgi:hypothetical protein
VSKNLAAVIAPILFSKVYFKIPFHFDTRKYPHVRREYFQKLAEQLGINVLQWARQLVISVGGGCWQPLLSGVPVQDQEEIDQIEAAAQSFAALLVSHGHELARIQYVPSQSCPLPTY